MNAAERHAAQLAAQAEAQVRVRAELVELAADRPAHAAYLAAMLTADDPDEVEPGRGVSARAEAALWADVHWIRYDLAELRVGATRAPFGREYRNLRLADARAAADRQRTRAAREAAEAADPLGTAFARIFGGAR